MSDDKMREEFEAAVIQRFKESGFTEVEIRTEMLAGDCIDYDDASVSAYWHFWKASRAAVVVELPAYADTGEDLGGWPNDWGADRQNKLIREFWDALRAVGLRGSMKA